jgi:hypothetical protein
MSSWNDLVKIKHRAWSKQDSFRMTCYLEEKYDMAKIPKEWHQYFWEVEPEKVDMNKHAFYVLERVLNHGDDRAVKKAREFYGDRMIKKMLLSTYSRGLSNRTIKLWQKLLKLSPEECERIASHRKHRLWPY